MAKIVSPSPDWLGADSVVDVYSVSSCVSDDFADYIKSWKHNGYWFFNSPADMSGIAEAEGVILAGTSLFYYEVHPKEFDGETWLDFSPEPSVLTDIAVANGARLEGFDVVTFSRATNAECSPLSCNSMAKEFPVNSHCLFSTLRMFGKRLTGVHSTTPSQALSASCLSIRPIGHSLIPRIRRTPDRSGMTNADSLRDDKKIV